MTKEPFSKTALACFLAAFISTMVLHRIGLRYFTVFMPGFIGMISLTYFAGILLYIFIWLRKAVRAQGDTSSLLAFWQDAVRYIIALDLTVFGVCKFFHVQFNTPLALLDSPFNTLDDSQLMWAFFGHSYPFTLIIGGLEVIGAAMLLFKKTRLLALFFLMPLCLNIFLLDFFYNGLWTAAYIGIEIIGLTYLLLIEYDRLYKFFFIDKSDLPKFTFKNAIWRNAIKLSVIIIPGILMILNRSPQYYPEINGKYEVKNLVINNIQQPAPRVDSVLTKVYIDKADLVLEYNNYQKRFIGSYKYNESTRELKGVWRYPGNQHDTFFAKILPGKVSGKKILSGHMGKESFTMELDRVD